MLYRTQNKVLQNLEIRFYNILQKDRNDHSRTQVAPNGARFRCKRKLLMRRGQILPSACIKKNAKSIEAETTSPKQNFDVAAYGCAALGEGPYAKPHWNRLIADSYGLTATAFAAGFEIEFVWTDLQTALCDDAAECCGW